MTTFEMRSAVIKPRRFCGGLIVILLMASSVFSQVVTEPVEGRPAQPDAFFGRQSFVLRSYAFPGAVAGKVTLEVRLSMVYDLLQFVKEAPDRYRAGYEVTAAILDAKGNEVAGRIFRNEIIVQRYEDTNSQHITRDELIRLDIPPGDYTLTLDIMDLDTQKHLRREEEIKAGDFSAGGLQVGSLALVSYTRAVAVRDSLQFNLSSTLRPRRELHGVYFEWADAAGDSITVQYTVRDAQSAEIGTWSETLGAGVRAHLVDMQSWAKTPGQYSIEVNVRDGNTAKMRKESFTVMSSPESNGVKSAPSTSGLYEPLRYIAKGSEYKRIAAAPEAERDSLIAEFWKLRDPTPDTPENELLNEYNRRLDFTIASFGVAGLGKAGWQTDRGRIYLQNGQPNDVQRQAPPGRGGVRYEIWYYKSLDRSFIFRERAGTGEYELVGQQ